MKGISTLDKVGDRVIELSRHCFDELIPTANIRFASLNSVSIYGEEHQLQPVAQKAVAARLNIPIEYLRRCSQEVQAFNLNHWLERERNEELFFRFDGMAVRAVFTPKYKPLDNYEVLQRLEELGYGPDARVQVNLDAEFMSLSIPDGRKFFDINGDRMTPGISIGNSEVGLSSLRIAAFFLRLKCTNGLIAKTEISSAYRHVSRKIMADFPRILTEVGYHLNQQRDQFRISMESRVEDPLATIKSLNRQFQVGQLEVEAVEWGYWDEPGQTIFHIVNAFTRAAAFPGLNAESSYRLQRIGGNILAMVK
jgi:hypothetical protein